ncbi:MAG: pantoate--beta-alanine ligase [Pseudomonadales bacterium]|nr:pantoate--beta-alanine ligase [Pseudomonadales bacterium]
MITVHDKASLRSWVSQCRQQDQRIGLAPTMGNLHTGHLRLLDMLRPHCDQIVCSIFVNPTQFAAHEDFGNYPRTLEADQRKLEQAGCDLVFAPAADVMYNGQSDQLTRVVVRDMENLLCGASRPGHFQGVATVVSKLFNLVQPDIACFGEKDYQQLSILRKMTIDLDFPITIVGCPTERESDGLAMSSRNHYLTPEERQRAPMLYRTLQQMRDAILQGTRDYRMLETAATGLINKSGFVTDYFSIADALTLQPADSETPDLLVAVAARLGSTRLIDNLTLCNKKA